MKLSFKALAMLILFNCFAASGKKAELFATKYFVFQSNLQLNAHLFLYNKAIACKFGNVPNDSLALRSFKAKSSDLSAKDLLVLNNVLLFYKDSLLSRDLLFDSLMRDVADQLSSGNFSKTRFKYQWQNNTFDNIKLFQPFFSRLYWTAIDSTNKAWLNAHKFQVSGMENELVPELERIYKTRLPGDRIRVDLCSYATWAGAYSYSDLFNHIILSTAIAANQGNHAPEVLFHETSHFLCDKLEQQIMALAKNRQLKIQNGLWHDMIFYTTGFVVEKYYKLKWQKFEPYYKEMKFEEKFPSFKNSVDGCKLYWDPYLRGQANFGAALSGLVSYLAEKK